MADVAGKMAVNKEHVAAAALLRAFFACCANDELCKGFLVRQHARCVEYASSTTTTATDGQIGPWKLHAIFAGLEGQLFAQLTFAACLTCLCCEEVMQQLNLGCDMAPLQAAGPSTLRAAWTTIAEDLYKALRTALEVLFDMYFADFLCLRALLCLRGCLCPCVAVNQVIVPMFCCRSKLRQSCQICFTFQQLTFSLPAAHAHHLVTHAAAMSAPQL